MQTQSILRPTQTGCENRDEMFFDLEKHLGTLKGTKFVYLPNSGNAGDSFIAHATYQLFDRLGLDFEIGNELLTYPGRTVVWGGGGNFIPLYVNLNNFLLANAENCERVIILPHTVQGYRSTLQTLGANCDIICRDRMSFDYVREAAPRVRAMLSHDIAFSTDFAATANQAKNFPIALLSDREFARRNIKRQLHASKYRIQSLGRPLTLNCFRTDAEKTGIRTPTPNIDVSAVYATGVMSRRDSLETTFRMMQFIKSFDVVKTNRLHIAIMSGTLGKTVKFFPNSYGKNQAVYEHSMAGRFGNIEWCG